MEINIYLIANSSSRKMMMLVFSRWKMGPTGNSLRCLKKLVSLSKLGLCINYIVYLILNIYNQAFGL